MLLTRRLMDIGHKSDQGIVHPQPIAQPTPLARHRSSSPIGYRQGPELQADRATSRPWADVANFRLSGMRKSWADGKRQHLEDCLGSFVAHVPVAADQLAELRASRASRASVA
jgi:hypothetical protein